MRTFSSLYPLQDASSFPWAWELSSTPECIPVWGVNIRPTPQFNSYNIDETGCPIGVGNPISYTWEALLDPADTPLPDWITEITP